jgi:hypothetical protein
MALQLNHDPVYAIGPWAGNVLDDFGVEWYVTEEAGWASGVNARSTIEEKSNDHGAADGPSYFEARTITLTGEAYAPSKAEVDGAKERLVTATLFEGLSYFTVTEYSGRKRWCLTRPTGSVQIKDISSRRFSWQFSVVAPDPRRYTDPVTTSVKMRQSTTNAGLRFPLRFPLRFTDHVEDFSGTIELSNDGNAETWPDFIVTGPCPGFVITETTSGSTITYTERLGDGDVLHLNSLTGEVVLNGVQDKRAALQFSYWWSIAAHGTAKVTFQSTGEQAASQLDVSVRNAWW